MTPQERLLKDIPFLFPPTSWFKAHPDYLNYLPIPRETITQQILLKQLEAATTWKGTCNALSNITKSTLVIVGADDDAATDSLILAEKIPGSWFIRIGIAGHGLMYQHPDLFNKLLLTFLENSRDDKTVNWERKKHPFQTFNINSYLNLKQDQYNFRHFIAQVYRRLANGNVRFHAVLKE